MQLETGFSGKLETAIVSFQFEFAPERQNPADVDTDGKGQARETGNGEKASITNELTPAGSLRRTAVDQIPAEPNALDEEIQIEDIKM